VVCVLQMLFGMPAAQVASRLEALPAALGITRDEALALVLDDPRFLLQPSGTLAAAWEELQQAASKQPEWRQQIGGWAASTFRRYAHKQH
jgi:hypothetical protein